MPETLIDVAAEVAALTAALAARTDEAYRVSMRRLIPSSMPAHAVHVPEIRRLVAEWRREHKSASSEDTLRLAEALWATGWREEGLLAIGLVARSKGLISTLPWEVVERWSSHVENWEHVDHLMGVSGAILVARPELLTDVERLADSAHSWQRRLAIVTLIEAVRSDPFIRPLESMADKLRGDRGPTLRKAVAWARKVLQEQEAKVG